MGCFSAFDIPWTTIITTATSGEFHPTGPWVAVNPNLDNGRGWVEVRGIQGTGMSVRPAIQTANDITSPDAHTNVAAAATSNGVKNPDSGLNALTVAGKKYIRAGVEVLVTSGTGSVRVAGRVEMVP